MFWIISIDAPTGIITVLIKKMCLACRPQIYGVEIHPCREAVHACQIHLHRVDPSVTAAGTRARMTPKHLLLYLPLNEQ